MYVFEIYVGRTVYMYTYIESFPPCTDTVKQKRNIIQFYPQGLLSI